MKKTEPKRRRTRISSSRVSGVSGPDAVRTIASPITPKKMDEVMKICVAIFCMNPVYAQTPCEGRFLYACSASRTLELRSRVFFNLTSFDNEKSFES